MKDQDEHALPSLSRVLGYIAIKNLHYLPDEVRVLTRLGYGDAEIALICEAKAPWVGGKRCTIARVKDARAK